MKNKILRYICCYGSDSEFVNLLFATAWFLVISIGLEFLIFWMYGGFSQ